VTLCAWHPAPEVTTPGSPGTTWQAMGGMQVGSIWGHGSYVAPDWTADWLHREAVFILDDWARAEHQAPFASLPKPDQAAGLATGHSYRPTTKPLVRPPGRVDAPQPAS
jgi:hypothetical protein